MRDWSTWFAWRPVPLLGGGWAWLEYVERHEDFDNSWGAVTYRRIRP